MVDKENVLRLLIVETSLNDAEIITSVLRNAGHAVRASSVEDAEDLQAALKDQIPDLVICSTELPDFGLNEVMKFLAETGKTIPVIASAARWGDEGAVVEALRAGARDLVSKEQPEHLQLVVNRELEFIHAQRALRRNDASLRESEKRCHALLESSRDAIAYVHEGMHVYANRAYLELFGYNAFEELEGTPIMDMVAPDDHSRFKEFLRNHGTGDVAGQIELHGLLPDGNTFDALLELAAASVEGEACTQIIIRSQLDQKELEQKIKQLSMKDLVTGLYNRQFFMDTLDEAVSRAGTKGTASALLQIVLDDFRAIKEQVGIAASDLVVGDLAKLLQSRVPEGDVLARFGDNTFALLTGQADPDGIHALAESIRSAVSDHISEVGTSSVTTTCSIGISRINDETGGTQEVLGQADLACAKAQAANGNCIEIFNAAAEQRSGKEKQQQWTERIQAALDNGRFRLVYQPIVSLHGDANEMYEVLLRMVDENGQEIPPNDFLAPTEQAGLMTTVDRWVFSHAVEVLAQRLQAGIHTRFFVKLAAASITDETLVPWLSDLLKEHRLPGDGLVLELSESVAFTHLKAAKTLVKRTRELHCGLALEHFGSGLNSFNLVKHLPADYLKIDGTFMRDLAENTETQDTVKSITDMAHSMGKLTIAEWVEDAGTLAVLWQCGVNYIQGYFLQEPDTTLGYDFSEGVL
ncbi:MAG: putative bifunctional diguanylate cyclase/phosphodiesterase [Gammaproteobacteria bacterium]